VYLWTLSKDLEPGNDYYIRVWFSPTVFAESEVFIVADPCNYMDCGLHGTCAQGVCNCLGGTRALVAPSRPF
jgi:hypothetical protein